MPQKPEFKKEWEQGDFEMGYCQIKWNDKDRRKGKGNIFKMTFLLLRTYACTCLNSQYQCIIKNAHNVKYGEKHIGIQSPKIKAIESKLV